MSFARDMLPEDTIAESRGVKDADAPGERLMFRVTLAAVLIILAVIAWPMILGLLYTADDLGWYHIPMRAYYAQCLAEGHNYNWMPSIHCGYYLQGEGQTGMYHPLHRLLYGRLSLTDAFNIELFLSYPMLLAGMYLLLRRWGLRRDASLFGGMLGAFSGFSLLHFIHPNMIAVFAHMPWILFCIDVSLGSDDRRKAAAANLATALLVASQLLTGHPQLVWFSSFTALVYAALVWSRQRGVRRAALLALAAFTGVLIGAVQLAPSYESLAGSMRWQGTGYSSGELSLAPLNLLQLVGPYLFTNRIVPDEPSASTHEYGLYAGAAALALVVWLVLNLPKDRDKRRLALAAIAFTFVALVLSLGRYAGLYTLLSHVPLVGSFRAPARYIGLVHFGMAVAGAVAFDSLASGCERRRGRGLWLIAIPAAAVAAVMLTGRVTPGWAVLSKHAASGAALAAGPLLAALAVIVVWAASRGARIALVALVVLAAADQGYYGLTYVDKTPPVTLAAFADSVRLPKAESFFRIEAVPTTDNVPTLNGFNLVTGYTGLTPRKALDYSDVAALRLASTAYTLVKTEEHLPDGSVAGRLRAQPVPDGMPRARLVANEVVTADPQAMLDKTDIANTALVAGEMRLGGGIPGSAAITRDIPGDMTVVTNAESRQLLVVSESYHRGWRATVDGAVVRPVPAYGDFLAVPVDKGRHEVAFLFDPQSLRVGKGISAAGVVLALGAFVAAFIPARRLTRGSVRRRSA